MTDHAGRAPTGTTDGVYDDSHWHVNTGGQTIHCKRVPGRFRNLKWLSNAVWLLFFFGPYLRWGDRQAILLDIPNRQFHIFDITIMPQDIWMLSLVLLFFAILLAVVTSVAGRVYCGFFCFQTVWTDLFTWVEDRLEGQPSKRRKLDEAPMNWEKIKIKVPKHAAWLLISMFTGLSFAAWFTDAYHLWHDYFTFQASSVAWAVLGLFTVGTYILAGFMREQACFWLCPYARIQGVMYDRETILPTYDYRRGEPRGKLKKGKLAEGSGDCVDCALCVAVCPTGIDIREGQQEGCITCALCIDACDSVMDKIGRPRGLVRYASLDELDGKPTKKLFQRPRVLVYFTIITLALVGILYGLTHLGTLELKVLHERQPLFVTQSDGSIQNKYELKILNKSDREHHVTVAAEGPDGLELTGVSGPILARPGHMTAYTVFVRVPRANLKSEHESIVFTVVDNQDASLASRYESMFVGPRH